MMILSFRNRSYRCVPASSFFSKGLSCDSCEGASDRRRGPNTVLLEFSCRGLGKMHARGGVRLLHSTVNCGEKEALSDDSAVLLFAHFGGGAKAQAY
jgi:hypothetical protein